MEPEATEQQQERKAKAREKMQHSLKEFFPQAEAGSPYSSEAQGGTAPVRDRHLPEPEPSVNLDAQAMAQVRQRLAHLSSSAGLASSGPAGGPGEAGPGAEPLLGDVSAAAVASGTAAAISSQPARGSRGQTDYLKRTKPQAEGPPAAELVQLKERLESAEREMLSMRRLGKTGFAVGVCAVAAVMMLTTTRRGETDEARPAMRLPFQVVDKMGKILLSLEADGGGTQLRLYNQQGKPVAWLSATNEGGYVSVSDQEQDGGAMLWANDQGGQLAISGKKPSPRLWMGNLERGGNLTVWDCAGNQVATLGAKEQGGSLDLLNRQGAGRAHLFADAAGGQIGFTNQAGKEIRPLTSRRAGPNPVHPAPAKHKAHQPAPTKKPSPAVMQPAPMPTPPPHVASQP